MQVCLPNVFIRDFTLDLTEIQADRDMCNY